MQTQLCLTIAALMPELFQSIRNRGIKPRGGLWTSTYQPDTRSSAWSAFCHAEFGTESVLHNPDHLYWSLVTPSSAARIYTIDCVDDLRAVITRYLLPMYRGDTRPQWIDFAAMSRDYDALRLTEHGELHTRYSVPNLQGYDCECTIWFRWCFDSVEIIKYPVFAC